MPPRIAVPLLLFITRGGEGREDKKASLIQILVCGFTSCFSAIAVGLETHAFSAVESEGKQGAHGRHTSRQLLVAVRVVFLIHKGTAEAHLRLRDRDNSHCHLATSLCDSPLGASGVLQL